MSSHLIHGVPFIFFLLLFYDLFQFLIIFCFRLEASSTGVNIIPSFLDNGNMDSPVKNLSSNGSTKTTTSAEDNSTWASVKTNYSSQVLILDILIFPCWIGTRLAFSDLLRI